MSQVLRRRGKPRRQDLRHRSRGINSFLPNRRTAPRSLRAPPLRDRAPPLLVATRLRRPGRRVAPRQRPTADLFALLPPGTAPPPRFTRHGLGQFSPVYGRHSLGLGRSRATAAGAGVRWQALRYAPSHPFPFARVTPSGSTRTTVPPETGSAETGTRPVASGGFCRGSQQFARNWKATHVRRPDTSRNWKATHRRPPDTSRNWKATHRRPPDTPRNWKATHRRPKNSNRPKPDTPRNWKPTHRRPKNGIL